MLAELLFKVLRLEGGDVKENPRDLEKLIVVFEDGLHKKTALVSPLSPLPGS